MGPEPEGASVEEQGLGWKNTFGSGNNGQTITSGLEGAWTKNPVKWDNNYFENLFGYEWELTKSPAGANQWTPKDPAAAGTVPDAHDPDKRHAPMMFTTDIALKEDPDYGKISRHFYENPEEFADAFAKAWFKLTHRDMGPISRYLGPLVPKEPQLWQDPVPAVDHELIGEEDVAALKAKILASGLTIPQLVTTAWASAATFRGSDKRGGANGARIRLAPQKYWEVNQPVELEKVLEYAGKDPAGVQRVSACKPAERQESFAGRLDCSGRHGSGGRGREKGRLHVKIPFLPGRTDASQEQTDVHIFTPLELKADGFRNYLRKGHGMEYERPAPELLVDRAQLLTLSAPEMAVLVGGMRVLGANCEECQHGVFTDRPGTLTNDFFVNLLDMNTNWQPSATSEGVYEGHDSVSGEDEVDGHVGGPGVRFQLAAARHLGSVCQRRFERNVREGLRGGLEQGDEPGSLRYRGSHALNRLWLGGADRAGAP